MKVKELIEVLKEHNQESHVVVYGYEEGVDIVDKVATCHIELNKWSNKNGVTPWYFGEHEIADSETDHKAVLITCIRGR